jgi:ABC-type Fe3+-hydroxamate transport system substrate-binding protein
LLYSKEDIKKISDLGAKTFAINANTIDDFTKQLYRLGALVNSESNASSYVDKILAARNTAQAQSLSRNPKVAVVLVGDGTEHMVAGTKSFLADVIRSAGGEPVGPDADRFVSLSPESFVASNPEMIVIAYPVFSKNEDLTREGAIKRAKKIVNDPRLKSVLAVQKELILPVDEDILTRRGYRVDRLIEEISRRIQAVAQK